MNISASININGRTYTVAATIPEILTEDSDLVLATTRAVKRVNRMLDTLAHEMGNAGAPLAYAPAPTEERREVAYAGGYIMGIVDENGRLLLRWKGGKWGKFGVAIYEEVYRPLGLNLQALRQGETFLTEGVTVEELGGKPKRVLSVNVSF